jgi:hypothetical protein
MLEDAPTIEPEPHSGRRVYQAGYADGFEAGRKAGAQEWIPCSERLPFAEYGESDNVLATCGHRDGEDTSIRWIKTLYFNGGNWCYPTGETYEQKVYAWMPLPECYQEDI